MCYPDFLRETMVHPRKWGCLPRVDQFIFWPTDTDKPAHSFHVSPLRKHVAGIVTDNSFSFLSFPFCVPLSVPSPHPVLPTWKANPKSSSARCTFEPILLGGFRILESDFTHPASEKVLASKTVLSQLGDKPEVEPAWTCTVLDHPCLVFTPAQQDLNTTGCCNSGLWKQERELLYSHCSPGVYFHTGNCSER